jgi:hypothetical protein
MTMPRVRNRDQRTYLDVGTSREAGELHPCSEFARRCASNKSADDAFQNALARAGRERRTVTAPMTERARTIAPSIVPMGGSSAGSL